MDKYLSGRSNTLLTKFVHSLSIWLVYKNNLYAPLRISHLGNIYMGIFKKYQPSPSLFFFFLLTKYDNIQIFWSFIRLVTSGMAFVKKNRDHHICGHLSLVTTWSRSHFLDPLILSFLVCKVLKMLSISLKYCENVIHMKYIVYYSY